MRVFISHASFDDAFVTRLANDLRAQEVMTWVDHEDISSGTEWSAAIEAGIQGSDVLVLVITRQSIQNPQCDYEWRLALQLQKIIIPVLMQATTLPVDLIHNQSIDFRADYGDGLQALLETLGVESENVRGTQKFIIQPSFELPLLEWVDIPDGDIEIEGQSYPINRFRLTKYPVTVAQYEFFVSEDGYLRPEFWSPAGLNWKAERQHPNFWDDPRWHIDTHPIVGVTWHEAMAFASWLNTKLRSVSTVVRLPTEWEWQFAAMGEKRNTYPWGNVFEEARANTSPSHGTTPVTQYADGSSPIGIWDMFGNTWEWCLNTSEMNTDGNSNGERVLRGGSWQTLEPTPDIRSLQQPNYAAQDVGFRVCAGVPLD